MNPAGALALTGVLALIGAAIAGVRWDAHRRASLARTVTGRLAVVLIVAGLVALAASVWWQVYAFEGRPYP